MKKQIICFLVGMIFMFGFAGLSNATLIDRGSGLIYDDDLDITWLQDANLTDGTMTWSNAISWAATLNYEGYTDWRLPTTSQPDASCSGQNGRVSFGFGCTGSEMGHLFNVEGISSAVPSLFANVGNSWYWSSSDDTGFGPSFTWAFRFDNGQQANPTKSIPELAWAVRDGDVAPVPAPGTILLFGSGIVGLVVYRKGLGPSTRNKAM